MNVGINGFGRIGKMVYKAFVEKGIAVTHINDPFLTPEYLAYNLKYDSTFGRSKEQISVHENKIKYGNNESILTDHKNPEDIEWNVDILIEASGVFSTVKDCQRHKCKKIIITAPSKDAKMFVFGVNHEEYNNESIISNASCTTNCLAPIAKIIDDQFEIQEGLMTTIHACTATQKIVDAAAKKDWRSGRSGMQNIIPSTTGAAEAVTKVIPKLEKKLTGMAMRVPVANVSVVDFTFKTKKKTCMKEISEKIKEAANNKMKNIVQFTDEDVVSSDFIGNSHSAIFDEKASMALNENFFKVIAWYDNEFGYSARVVDMANFIYAKK
ncbi:hypothetical protein GVAV_001344 [Gurleya vavrai]